MIDLLENTHNTEEAPLVEEKRKRGRPRKVVEETIITDKKIVIKSEPIIIDINKYNFKNITLSELMPIIINDVVLAYDIDGSGRVVMYPPENFNSVSFENWIHGRGGIFYKDIINKFRHGIEASYGLLENIEETLLVRFITTEEELNIYRAKQFIEGTINNKDFTIIKKYSPDESINNTNRKMTSDISELISSEEDEIINYENDEDFKFIYGENEVESTNIDESYDD